MDSPFRVVAPTAEPVPLLIEVPHAGTRLPADLAAPLVAPLCAIFSEADLYVDELFAEGSALGATLLFANWSRIVVDLNRSEKDVTAAVVEGRGRSTGAPRHGLIWSHVSSGAPCLSRPLSAAELEARMVRAYRPYHATLARLLEEMHARFGYAVLLAAHSMPSYAKDRRGVRVDRADIVPGTRGRTTATDKVISTVERVVEQRGLSLHHDQPYAGGYATVTYGHPSKGFSAIQIEVSRKLYMNEETFARSAKFAETKELCTDLIRALASVG